MATLTPEQAKQQGYTGHARHMPTVECPRMTDQRIYCATCQGAIAQLARR